MIDKRNYELLSYADDSGITIGDTGMLVETYQMTIGVKVTGIWSLADEEAYRVYADKQNWAIIRDVLKMPAFWDLCVPEGDLLDLEF